MVIVTEWVQYRALDLERLKSEMAQPVVVDLRNIYRPEDMAAHGFIYESVGRAAEPQGLRRHCINSVMAGLVPAIHVLFPDRSRKTWMPGTLRKTRFALWPGMTTW